MLWFNSQRTFFLDNRETFKQPNDEALNKTGRPNKSCYYSLSASTSRSEFQPLHNHSPDPAIRTFHRQMKIYGGIAATWLFVYCRCVYFKWALCRRARALAPGSFCSRITGFLNLREFMNSLEECHGIAPLILRDEVRFMRSRAMNSAR